MNLSLKVLDIPTQRVGAKLVDLYREETTPKQEQERFKIMQASKEYYRKKGIGRPTKKDRRELDDYMDETE